MIFSKKNSLLFFLLLIFCSTSIYTQNSIKISLHQDLKLLAFGDNLGNRAGTLDIISRLKYESKKKKLGFFVLGIEYEKANIKNNYSRYGTFLGYNFNPLFNDDNFYLEPSIGYGVIHRKKFTPKSWSVSIQTAYKLGENIKLSSIIQFTERTDLKMLYSNKETRYSFFIGVEYNLFSFN